MNVNRKHKDSMFSSLFSNPDVLRELYSAISGVTIAPDIPVEINTLTDVLFMNQVNDLSFTIDNRLVVLIEHQSTVSENLPLRFLEYTGRIYEKIIDRKKIYHAQLVKIHEPEFIVLYNGTDPYPDYKELRLSDAFMNIEGLKPEKDRKIPLELVVQVYNINHEHNREILEKCETLDSYSTFIDRLREHRKAGLTLEESTENAIKYCIDRNILAGFFQTISSEVLNMLTDEWDWEEFKEVFREETREQIREEIREEFREKAREEFREVFRKEGREEGIERGREQTMELTARNLLVMEMPIDDIAQATGLPVERVRALASG
jgi:predicted transposase/invertase (TIGR01784 family)